MSMGTFHLCCLPDAVKNTITSVNKIGYYHLLNQKDKILIKKEFNLNKEDGETERYKVSSLKKMLKN